MRVLSLCSGIGGIDLAAEAAGMQIVGQVEIDPFCQAVLAKHWPNVPRCSNLYDVTGDEFGPIDLLIGGIPCQPFSQTGHQRGTADDRHLWPQMFRLVQACQPAWVIVENVAGFINLALDDVCADLESADYDTQALVLPACAIGAPHKRERTFLLAHTRRERCPTGGAGMRDAPLGALSHLWSTNGGLSDEWDTLWQAESSLGREPDGLSNWLDRDWPAGPGPTQKTWEPPRIIQESLPNRAARIKALGNAVVPSQIFPLLAAIMAVETTHDSILSR